jgi:hypothetical protein
MNGAYNRKICILAIDKLPSISNLAILGDVFFHQKTIVFDKKNNQIGFISQEKIIAVFPETDFIYKILDSIAVFAIIASILIFFMRKKNSNNRELT